MKVPAAICAAFLASLLGACKQGVGDVCQVNDDCEEPLQCNAGTGRCQPIGSGDETDEGAPPDAALPADAGPTDAPPPPDAAPTDAPPPPDAAPADAVASSAAADP